MTRRSTNSLARGVFQRSLKLKIIAALTAIGAALFAALFAISTVTSIAAAPAAAIQTIVGSLFGSEPDSISEDPDTAQAVRDCLTVSSMDELTAVLMDVSPDSEPEFAHAWVLYSLALHGNSATHPARSSSSPSSSPAVPDSRSHSRSGAGDAATDLDLSAFTNRWRSASIAATSSPYALIDGVPQVLMSIAPTLDFAPYIVDAAAAVLELDNRGTISMSEAESNAAASVITQQCLFVDEPVVTSSPPSTTSPGR